jgi:hypothetical protein
MGHKARRGFAREDCGRGEVAQHPRAARLDRVQVRWHEERLEQQRAALRVVEVHEQAPVHEPRATERLRRTRPEQRGCRTPVDRITQCVELLERDVPAPSQSPSLSTSSRGHPRRRCDCCGCPGIVAVVFHDSPSGSGPGDWLCSPDVRRLGVCISGTTWQTVMTHLEGKVAPTTFQGLVAAKCPVCYLLTWQRPAVCTMRAMVAVSRWVAVASDGRRWKEVEGNRERRKRG